MAGKSIVLPVATANYVSVFKPKMPPNPKEGDEKQFTLTLTYDKKEKDPKILAGLKAFKEAILEVAEEKWPGKGKQIVSAMKWPVIADGDDRLSPSTGEPMFPGRLFVVAKRRESFGAPGIVDQKVQRLLDPARIYAGALVRVEVNLYPFSHSQGGRGVGVGLSNIQLVGDGFRIDGRHEPEEAFADFVEADVDEPDVSDLT